MSITVRDIVPFSSARTHLSELVEQVQNGAEKIITKNGEPAVALIDAKRLDHYHRLERASIHLLLLGEIEKGLADVEAGRSTSAREGLAALKARRITR
ncbi:type II toxin-antitoxin system Phd/YefM family antitoxin [Variovorax sp. OV700]|jgi:prevent-host-death family protein|uniref:type II toxin-antitoxin system Phd/YefM family antitoxin n=1 Tax=Variovorax sp. OV700 TaxID=1882826 RepID=UPI000889F1A9|nr:type II toxin-antitoxin system Phd/YefM family antitoxin [Variovorax sp. OV700]SDH71425.1 prevent-host-death family protein [Variovorax sp. OV700]